MPVKVISRRQFRVSQKRELVPLLQQLQELARQHQGFISRATCSKVNDPGECIVISEWDSVDSWMEWMNQRPVQDIQWQIDSLIGEKTFFDIYRPEEF